MPNLMQTINAAKELNSVKLSRCKTSKSMNISASVDVKRSADFHLVTVAKDRVPMLFASGCAEEGPIVLDRNYNRIGKINCDYVPKIIVLSGRRAVRELKASKSSQTSAWVGDGALLPLHIKAADALSNSAIEQKLSELIRETYKPKQTTTSNKGLCDYDYPSYPYLRDVFQGDGYCIFQQAKAMFRQNYKVDAKTRNVTLDGNKIEVIQTYTPAPAGDVSSSIAACGPTGPANAKTGLGTSTGSFAGFPAMAEYNVDITTFGATTSEANNPQYKQMSNVEEALAQYLAILKDGFHKPVSMMGLTVPAAYINAARATAIAMKASKVNPKTFSMMDFIKWQDGQMSKKSVDQVKLVDGDMLCSTEFAYVGDTRDISTWHLPIASKSFVARSLEEMSACAAIPKFERAEVQERVRNAALVYGVKLAASSTTSMRVCPDCGVKSGKKMCPTCKVATKLIMKKK